MAITAEGAALSERHRLAQLAIRAALVRDLTQLWPLFDVRNPETFDRFAAAASTLVRIRNRDSAGLAVRYLSDFRRLEGIGGSLVPVVSDPPSDLVTREALRATGLVGVLNARRSGFSPEAAAANGFVRVSGSATSLTLGGGRSTIVESLRRDPARPRWHRVTSSKPCSFCRMAAGRGDVFTDESVRFRAHDHCSCSAEPAYRGSSLPPLSETFRRQWEETTAGLSGSDALNAFRRAIDGS